MQEPITAPEQNTGVLYQHAAELIINQKMTATEVASSLVAKGATPEDAERIAWEMDEEVIRLRQARAKKDVLYGALWCVGGTGLTLANIGYIFWGAILFGGIQLVRGLINMSRY
jgi:hypothetical protein